MLYVYSLLINSLNHLCSFKIKLTAFLSQPETVKKASSENNVETFDSAESFVHDYPFLLMGCLRLLLENNSTNATMFRECGGARCVHNIVPYSTSRMEALKIIRELILSGGNDDFGKMKKGEEGEDGKGKEVG